MRAAWMALVLGLELLAKPATAQDLESFRVRDTGSLAALCATSESSPLYGEARQHCYGFIKGAGSMYRVMVAAGVIPRTICATSEPTVEQLRAAFVDWVQRNPEARSEDAVDGLFRAVAATWPCQS